MRDGSGASRRNGGPGRGDALPRGVGSSFVAAVSPDARVSLRDQILVQLAGALREDRLAPGDRLPSVRGLARRLGVHRHTVRAAYRAAAAAGLVSVRAGSGVYVRGRPGESDPFRAFVVRERARAGSYRGVWEVVGRWRRAVEARRVTVVGDDAALLEVWAAELGEELAPGGVRVSVLERSAAARFPGRLAHTVVAGPAGALGALEPHLPRWTETVLLRPGPPRRLPRLLAGLPAGSVLAVATRAPRLAADVRCLAAARRGGDLAVVRVDSERRGRADRMFRVARIVLADVTARGRLAGRVDSGKVLTLRHLPRSVGRELAGAFRAGSDAEGIAVIPREEDETP